MATIHTWIEVTLICSWGSLGAGLIFSSVRWYARRRHARRQRHPEERRA